MSIAAENCVFLKMCCFRIWALGRRHSGRSPCVNRTLCTQHRAARTRKMQTCKHYNHRFHYADSMASLQVNIRTPTLTINTKNATYTPHGCLNNATGTNPPSLFICTLTLCYQDRRHHTLNMKLQLDHKSCLFDKLVSCSSKRRNATEQPTFHQGRLEDDSIVDLG